MQLKTFRPKCSEIFPLLNETKTRGKSLLAVSQYLKTHLMFQLSTRDPTHQQSHFFLKKQPNPTGKMEFKLKKIDPELASITKYTAKC